MPFRHLEREGTASTPLRMRGMASSLMFIASRVVCTPASALAAQSQSITSSPGVTDWATIFAVVIPVVTALVPQLFSYLSERRAQRDWNGILKAIDVYNRWAEIGDTKSILLLQQFIDSSIKRQASPRRSTGTYVVGAFGLLGNAYLALSSIANGKPFLAVPACVSFALMMLMLVRLHRGITQYEDEMNGIIAESEGSLEEEVSSLRQAIRGDLTLEALEKEREMNARLANLLSPSDPFARRLYRSALDKAGVTPDRDVEKQVQNSIEQVEY